MDGLRSKAEPPAGRAAAAPPPARAPPPPPRAPPRWAYKDAGTNKPIKAADTSRYCDIFMMLFHLSDDFERADVGHELAVDLAADRLPVDRVMVQHHVD